MYKHILIPTDGSRLSNKAAKHGIQLAKALGARVTGLFAAPTATPIIYRHALPVGFIQPAAHARMIEHTAKRVLAVIATAAKRARVPCECEQVVNDFPADAILALAKRKRCDLIVMGSHGQHGIKGILLGSETHKVLTRSGLPVLVCR